MILSLNSSHSMQSSLIVLPVLVATLQVKSLIGVIRNCIDTGVYLHACYLFIEIISAESEMTSKVTCKCRGVKMSARKMLIRN